MLKSARRQGSRVRRSLCTRGTSSTVVNNLGSIVPSGRAEVAVVRPPRWVGCATDAGPQVESARAAQR